MKLELFNSVSCRRVLRATLPALAFAALVTSAQAANLVINGGFEEISIPQSTGIGSAFPSQQLNGWTAAGRFSFVYTPGTADTTGASCVASECGAVRPFFKLWGPGTGSNNGLPATSPLGGNFVALDGDSTFRGPLSQTINGLTPGEEATLSFYWAAAQQWTFNGPTTEQVRVSLGGESFLTEVLNNPNHGFQPWRQVSFTFTPTSSSEVLSFLAIGTPSGMPPFVLLDGVSLEQETPPGPVPEPGAWALMTLGLAGLSGFARLRRKSANSATADKA